MKSTMTKILLLALTLLLAPTAPAVDNDGPAITSFKKAIRSKYDMKEKAFADHDPDTIVDKFYSEDVMSVGEGENMVFGRKQLRPLYVEVTQTHPTHVKIESFNTKVSGNMGWDWADFHVIPDDPKEKPFTFKILFLWEKRQGEWWCVGDIYLIDHSKDQKMEEG